MADSWLLVVVASVKPQEGVLSGQNSTLHFLGYKCLAVIHFFIPESIVSGHKELLMRARALVSACLVLFATHLLVSTVIIALNINISLRLGTLNLIGGLVFLLVAVLLRRTGSMFLACVVFCFNVIAIESAIGLFSNGFIICYTPWIVGVPICALYFRGMRFGLFFFCVTCAQIFALFFCHEFGLTFKEPIWPAPESPLWLVLSLNSVFVVSAMGFLYSYSRRSLVIEVLSRENKISALIESTPDLVCAMDTEYCITAINGAFLKKGQQQRLIEPKIGDAFTTLFPEELSDVWKQRLDQAREGHILRFEECEKLSDEGENFYDVVLSPTYIHDQCAGLVFVGRDVTQKKKNLAELERSHKESLELSRKAGMAEVAVGVLHNVGNMLNSVSVTTELLPKRLKIKNQILLGKTVDLLKENEENIGEYINTDPKGKKVLRLLEKLVQQISHERSLIVRDADDLARFVEHMESIVNMQQAYANTRGFLEATDVNEVISHACNLNSASLQRHNIKVDLELATIPELKTDRSKLLQILVNLIANAKAALEHVDQPEKVVCIEARSKSGQCEIAVTDNGEGIPEDELTKIFNFGFTSREDGHGFGLHVSSNQAKALGGTLTGFSEGRGKGACFVLSLPLVAPS